MARKAMAMSDHWLRDETGAVIRELIRWRWRTLRNVETGAIRRERGPLAIQHERGAVWVEFGRLWLTRCAPAHPNEWMLVWRRKRPDFYASSAFSAAASSAPSSPRGNRWP